MQPPDLLSLFQRAPSQPTTATTNADAERSALQSPTHENVSVEGTKDIESLFRNLETAPPQDSPSNVPLPVHSPPESVVSNSTVTSNADRQALLSLLGTVGVQKPASAQPLQPQPQVQAQPQQPAPPQQTVNQVQSLLQQLVASEPAPASQMSHSVPPPASHQQTMASALPPHLSDREAQAEMQRKSLFDFVSPYDALQSGQSQSQLYIGPPVAYQPQVAHASHSAGPSAAKKKPVPVYNPSPAPGSQNPSPQISPKQPNIPQRRHTPSPEPGQYVNAYSQPQPPPMQQPQQQQQQLHHQQQQQQQQQQQEEQYAESLHSEPMPPQALPPTGIDSSSETRNVPLPQSYPSSGGISQHGPLPPIPQGRSSPVAPPLAQRPIIPQQVQQPLPSPPLRSQQMVYDSQQQYQAPQQPQQHRGRGSPASSRQTNGPSPSTNARDGAGSPAGSGRGNVQDINKKPAAPKISSPYSTQSGQLKNGRQQQYSPSVHSLITIDVTSPLTSTMAAQDIASITPIALLKLEPTYTRGTTIGVANFIAYAMSRGRIRLIGRQTGERALLKLPATFPGHAQVQDMVISGTKLACVSTDGGVVVWDIPEDIEDDAASVSRIILHVPPHPDVPGFKVVKWHPKQAGVLAIASEKEIYLLNIEDSQQTFGSDGVSQAELARVSTVFQVPSPLVSFTFDVPQVALASISIDSTVTLWSMRDKAPFWSGRVQGEGIPSSIDFLDGGLVVGRNQGNVIQLLPAMSTQVLSTIKFVLGKPLGDNQDLMFGHFCYDPASKILWVASSARPSLFAVKIGAEMYNPEGTYRPTFDQIVEFSCSAPAINLTVVPAESVEENSNWTRDASLVVSAFCVHSGGVDQINISQDAYDEAAMRAEAKLPNVSFGGTPSGSERENGRRQSAQSQTSNTGAPAPAPAYMMQQPPRPAGEFQNQSYAAPQQQQIPNTLPSYGNMQQRPRSPLSQEPITQSMYDPQPAALVQAQAKAAKAKDVGPVAAGKQTWKASPSTSAVDPGSSAKSDTEALTVNLTKEMRRVEESLHNKVSRLIIKELDKQQVRLEEVRHADQTADFERQEKILKLISTELTRNTTRVVESAVKNVIQNSVLPALENVTRSEVKVALNAQISKGLAESMKQTLPVEIEKLLLRPDVSNHVARTFSAAITPVVERNVLDTIHNTLIPAYSQANGAMHQELTREIRSEILNLKKEVVTWQSDALKGTEAVVREMEQSIRSLAEQVKILSAQVASSAADATLRAKVQEPTPDYAQQLRQPAAAPPQSTHSAFLQSYGPSGGWVNSSQPQPLQASQPPLNLPQSSSIPTTQPAVPANRPEDWDETFLSTLGMHDQKKLRELLVRASPDVVMPTGQPSPLSQTVILALIHRLALSSTELSPADDAFKTSLYWLQRSVYALNPNDNVIAPYINRVLQTAVGTLNTTAQRMNVLPGGPSLADASNMINQIQQSLSSLMT